MLRACPHLCQYMPAHKESRRLLPNPDHEPDFCTISTVWPIPLKTSQTAVVERSTEATHCMILNEMLMKLGFGVSIQSASGKSLLYSPSLVEGLQQKRPAVSQPHLEDAKFAKTVDVVAVALKDKIQVHAPPPANLSNAKIISAVLGGGRKPAVDSSAGTAAILLAAVQEKLKLPPIQKMTGSLELQTQPFFWQLCKCVQCPRQSQ